MCLVLRQTAKDDPPNPWGSIELRLRITGLDCLALIFKIPIFGVGKEMPDVTLQKIIRPFLVSKRLHYDVIHGYFNHVFSVQYTHTKI